MGGVYGAFLEHFPELYEPFSIWTAQDKSDIRTIRAVFMPDEDEGLRRIPFDGGATALDLEGHDQLYVSSKYDSKIKEGDFVSKAGDNIVMKVTKSIKYDKAAGYRVYRIERLTGTTNKQKLKIKEGHFA